MGAGLLVDLVEADRLAVDRAVELHGHGDEPEADGAGPDRTGHGPSSVPEMRRVAHLSQAFLRRGQVRRRSARRARWWPRASKFSGASQVSNPARIAGHSESMIAYQAVS